MSEAFEKICDWLEKTADRLVNSMPFKTYMTNWSMICEYDIISYSPKSFGEKLKAKYKNHVYYVKVIGCKGELIFLK